MPQVDIVSYFPQVLWVTIFVLLMFFFFLSSDTIELGYKTVKVPKFSVYEEIRRQGILKITISIIVSIDKYIKLFLLYTLWLLELSGWYTMTPRQKNFFNRFFKQWREVHILVPSFFDKSENNFNRSDIFNRSLINRSQKIHFYYFLKNYHYNKLINVNFLNTKVNSTLQFLPTIASSINTAQLSELQSYNNFLSFNN